MKYFEALQGTYKSVAESLVHSAGIDSGEDRKLVGYLTAVRDMLNVAFEDIDE